MTAHRLFFGCGQGIGQQIMQVCREQGDEIWHAGRHTVHAGDHWCPVNWQALDSTSLHRWLRDLPVMESIFFNQKHSALAARDFAPDLGVLDTWKLVAHCQQAYFVSCLLPMVVINTLQHQIQSHTRVAWMLSSLIVQHSDPQHADYIAGKYQNMLVMRNYALHRSGCFFGIDPGHLADQDQAKTARHIADLLRGSTAVPNGEVVLSDGTRSRSHAAFWAAT